MDRPPHLFLAFFFLLFFSSFPDHRVSLVVTQKATSSVDVGVVLDLGTLQGKRSLTSISLAIDDFYTANGNDTTRVILHTRNSKGDIVRATSAALDLLKNDRVQAIIGPTTSAEAKFVVDLGNRTLVPILSFSATSPFLSSSRTPYFVRTTVNESSQTGAIAAVVKSFGWQEVVPIYEDTEYGADILPSLLDAFQAVDARVPYRSVIPPSPSDDQITAELYKLMTMQTRVFVVHMMQALGSRLFTKAAEVGLMSEGYVWIATDRMASTLELLDAGVINAMQGVLGVRPYVPKSKQLDNFTARWRARFRHENPSTESAEPTIFQLWAYDTAWALALAVEKAGARNPRFQKPQGWDNSTDLAALGVSQAGPGLLQAIQKTRFHGVAGEFQLIDGQLQSSAFEIVNVIEKVARGVGFWNPATGLSRQLNSATNRSSPASVVNLKPIIWPGESTVVPKGWQIPTSGKKLQIGVPVKDGFNVFNKAKWDPTSNATTMTGYCIDVFDAVTQMLPYSLPYEYVPFGNASNGVSTWTYDDLVYQVFIQKFDAVVADVTIIANRSNYVDFTLPFTESGVSMIVPIIKDDSSKNAWIFLKPLKTDLWLGSLAFFFFTGFVVWVIEHRINEEFRGPPSQQLGLIFYFAFSTLVFAHKEKLESNLSRFAVIIWVFLVLILTSSYTASLTSMLTVQQLQPSVADVSVLLKNGDYVGYQDGSFVVELLKRMKFDETKLKNLSTPDQYADALSKGSKNGGVGAIFDEIPYLKYFLSKHCADYTMVGPTYMTNGFGFVFPRGSPLVPDLSRAILNVMEGDTIPEIQRKWLGDPSTCSPTQRDGSTRLDFGSFGGLFLITGAVMFLALFVFFANFLYKERKEMKAAASGSSLWKTLKAWAKYYDHKDPSSRTFNREKPTNADYGGINRNDQGVAWPNADGSQSPCTDENLPEDGMSAIELGNRGMETPLPEDGMSEIEVGNPGMETPAAKTSTEMTEIRVEN